MKKIRLPEMIDYFRKENSWTMKEFGEKLGKSESAISKWIKGVRSPMVEDFDKMVNLFNTDPDTLMYGASDLSTTLSEITKVSSQLEEPRQQIVLDTANFQLDEQQKLIEKAKKRAKKILSFSQGKVDFDKISNVFPYDPDKEGYAPVIGEIAAGTPILAEENFEGMRPVYGKYAGRDDVFWIRVRGESMETEIHDGSFALILQDPNLAEGSIGAVRFIDDNCATLKCVYYEYDENGSPLRLRLEPLNPDYPILYADEYNPAEIEGRLVKVEQDY